MKFIKVLVCISTLLGSLMALPAYSQPTSIEFSQPLTNYKIYVIKQLQQFVIHTKAFSKVLRAGNNDAVQALYIKTYEYYARIAPAASGIIDDSTNDLMDEPSLSEKDMSLVKDFAQINDLIGSDKKTSPELRQKLAEQLNHDVKQLQNSLVMEIFTPKQVISGALQVIKNNRVLIHQSHDHWRDILQKQQASLDGLTHLLDVIHPVVKQYAAKSGQHIDHQLKELTQTISQHLAQQNDVSQSIELDHKQQQAIEQQWHELLKTMEQLKQQLI